MCELKYYVTEFYTLHAVFTIRRTIIADINFFQMLRNKLTLFRSKVLIISFVLACHFEKFALKFLLLAFHVQEMQLSGTHLMFLITRCYQNKTRLTTYI